MPGNPKASVFIGNLDEKVDERALYEIMVQAGPLVDLHMPRDKETKRHKGYAFAEFTTEESALYAVSLFSGLVFLHKKLLRFSISGQDKVVQIPPQKVRDSKLLDRSCVDSSSQHSQRPPMPLQSPPFGYYSSPVGGLKVSSEGSVRYPSPTAQSSHSGVGQRLDFSPLAHTQSYNARLVSLGQAGLQSHLHNWDQSFANRFY